MLAEYFGRTIKQQWSLNGRIVDDLSLEIQSIGGDGAGKQHLRDAKEPCRF